MRERVAGFEREGGVRLGRRGVGCRAVSGRSRYVERVPGLSGDEYDFPADDLRSEVSFQDREERERRREKVSMPGFQEDDRCGRARSRVEFGTGGIGR